MKIDKIEVSSEDIDFATSAKEEIACDYSGDSMNIGFKGSSLNEILNNLSSAEVTLQLADPSRPCLIVPVEQPEDEEILMLIAEDLVISALILEYLACEAVEVAA